MRLTVGNDLERDETHYHLVITREEWERVPLDRIDCALLSEANTISDNLLALQTVAVRLEQTEGASMTDINDAPSASDEVLDSPEVQAEVARARARTEGAQETDG